MLLWYLLIIQLVMSNADLMCFYAKYPECYVLFLGRRDHEFCSGANQTIKCIKETVIECDTEDSRVVLDMEQRLKGACQEGEELNKAYLKHKTCVFELLLKSAANCSKESRMAINDYHLTGKKDEDELFKLSCRFDNQTNLCMIGKVPEICGEEAAEFYHEFYGPTMELLNRVCMENGSASFNFVWTLVLQASTVLFAQKLSNFTI